MIASNLSHSYLLYVFDYIPQNYEFIYTYLFLLLSTVSGNAQFPAIPMPKNVQKTNTIDSANIRVLYALNPVDISNITTYDDLQRLEIGDSLSKYYSFFIYNSDSLITEWKNKYKMQSLLLEYLVLEASNMIIGMNITIQNTLNISLQTRSQNIHGCQDSYKV